MNWDLNTNEGLKNAVEWQTALVQTIFEGGSWIVPRSMSIYRIRHSTQTAEKLSGFPEPDIEKVFEAMGWTVIESEGTANPPFGSPPKGGPGPMGGGGIGK